MNKAAGFLSYLFTMIKLRVLAVVAIAALASTTAFAGGKGCCTSQAKNEGGAECSKGYEKMNLSAEQKAKLDGLQATCHKAGCTKESMAAFMKGARDVLSAEQFAQLKAECDAHMSNQTQS